MNLDQRYDRIGIDHNIRRDLRNFLLVYRPRNVASALYALHDGRSAPAEMAAKELYGLFHEGYSIDYVYQFSTADIRRFANYTKNEAQIEKVRYMLAEACKLAFAAGVKHEELQNFVVDEYETLSIDKDFVYRFSMEKNYGNNDDKI